MFIYQGFVNYGVNNVYCVKSVRILSYSGSYFPAFRLNTEKYAVSLCIQSKCGKMRTRITPNTDTFYAVVIFWIHRKCKRECLDLYIQSINVSVFKLLYSNCHEKRPMDVCWGGMIKLCGRFCFKKV